MESMIFKRSTVVELPFIGLENFKFFKHKKKNFLNSKCSLCSFLDCAEGGGCTPLSHSCAAELLKAKTDLYCLSFIGHVLALLFVQ